MKKRITALLLALILSANMTGGIFAEETATEEGTAAEETGDVEADVTQPSIESEEVAAEAVKLSSVDNAYGTATFNESGSYTEAFDGVKHTFYDAAHTTPQMEIGIELDSPAQLTQIRFHPRVYMNEFEVPEGIEFISGTAGYVYDDFSENGDNLFDGNTDTIWCGEFTGTAEVVWKMPEAITITGYSMANNYGVCHDPEWTPKSWTLYGLGEGDTWTEIDSRTTEILVEEPYARTVFSVANTTAYQQYKLVITEVYGKNRYGDVSVSNFALSSFDLIDGEKYTADEPYFRLDTERLKGLVVEGSVTGVNWEPLCYFPDETDDYTPDYYTLQPNEAAGTYSFTKFRLRNLTNHLEMAEIEFIGIENSTLPQYPASNAAPSDMEEGYVLLNTMEGAELFGSDAFSEDTTYDMAFDGIPATFFDAVNSNAYMELGVSLAEPMQLRGVRYYPRVYCNDDVGDYGITPVSGTAGYIYDDVNENYENLFDGNTLTEWCGPFEASAEVVWELPETATITGYSIAPSRGATEFPECIPVSWTLYGLTEDSENGNTWTEIDSQQSNYALVADPYNRIVFETPDNTTAYKQYRLVITELNGINAAGEAQLDNFCISSVDLIDDVTYFGDREYFYTDTDRIEGLVIEGSNNGVGWDVLYTISADDRIGYHTVVQTLLDGKAHDYTFTQFRIRHLGDSHLEMGELEFYGVANPDLEQYPSSETLVDGITAGSVLLNIMEGTEFYGSPAFSEEATYDKAFDGDYTTFYDTYAGSSIANIGIEVAEPMQLTGARFFPRNNGLRPEISVISANTYNHWENNLFDYNPVTVWMTDVGNTDGTVVWEMPEETFVTGYVLYNYDQIDAFPEQAPTSWALYGSNDLETWTLIDEQIDNDTLTTEAHTVRDEVTDVFPPYVIKLDEATEAYVYFKLDINAAAGLTNEDFTNYESLSIATLSGIDLLGYSDNYVYEEDSYYPVNPHRAYTLIIEGSYDGVGWETLHNFDYRYCASEYNLIATEDLTEAASEYTYKYFRIRNPEGTHMEVAELEFYGITNDELPTYPEKEAWVKGVDYVVVEEVAPDEMADAFGSEYPGSVNWGFPEVTSGELLSGTIIAGYNGEYHTFEGNSDNASWVFDGNIDTFFDPFEASTASWAGLMLDDTYELTEVRIIPRADWYDRFAGIAVQGSNDGVTWDTIVWYTGDEAPAGWEYHCFTPETNEEYVNIYAEAWGLENLDLSEHWIGGGAYQIYRCVNLGGMHGNFAEIELYGNYVDTNTCEHELTYVEALAKTCTTDGNIEHWHCGLCGRNFADEAAAKRLIKVTIPASHTLTGIWETNETEHLQRCHDCNEIVEDTIGVHCYSVNCTAVINCDVCALTLSTGGRTTWEEGLDYVVMDDILTDDEKGELYGENYPASSLAYGWGEVTEGELLKGTVITGYNGIQHNWIHEDGSNPDNGNTAFDGNVHTCFDPFAAETNSWVGMIMEEGYQLTEVRIMPREGWLERMVGGAVQGSNDGINWVNIVYLTGVYECPAGFDFHCFTPETNTEYTAKYDAMGVAEPDMSTYWVNNGAYKYFRYVNLEGIHGNVGEIELYGEVYEGEHQHILTEVAEKAETCTTDGNSTYWHCESCGLNYTDETAETAIDDVVKKASGHNIALVEANPASCTATGNIKHYKCSTCGVRFTDEAGTAVAENTTIPATGHDWGDGWIITTKPTTENVGKATRTCVNCNLSENKDVAAVTVAVTNEATTDATEEKNQVSVNVIGDESEAVVVIDEESLSTTLDTLGAGSGESANTTAASGNITIDVGSAVDETTEIKQVTIPTGAITDVAAAAASNDNATTGLEVKLSTGSVVFDATALNAIAAVANESEASNIELKIEKIATDDTTSVAAAASETMTTDAQKDTLDAMESDEAVQLLDAVDLTAGDVHELGSEAIISIPFDADGVDTDGLKITYIHVDGTVEEITPEYADGYLIFKVSHFSVYFIAWSEPVYTLSGTVTSYGLDSTAFGVELILNTPANSDADTMSTIEPVTLKGNKAVFTFENLVKGEYTLIINKKNHFVEKISVTIGGDTVEDIELIHSGHIVGKDEDDTTKDLTVDDLRIMNEYFAGISNNLPENIADLADVDGDDQFTRKDLMIMTRLLNGWNYTLKQ